MLKSRRSGLLIGGPAISKRKPEGESMADITIEKKIRDDRHGRYIAHIDGIEAKGELTLTRRGPDRISADHTGVRMNSRAGALCPRHRLSHHCDRPIRAQAICANPNGPIFSPPNRAKTRKPEQRRPSWRRPNLNLSEIRKRIIF
jgi:hypothetical protein